ncbi:MAG: hypothetical protein HY205_00800 [Nitrospirae bacterium]|nr:hypothetical protein [Nitrospirota bacterium]
MKRLPIEQLTPGMVLAKPASNPAGQMILPAGAELTEALIVRLQDMGLTSAHVENSPGEGGAPAQTLAELEQALDRRFRKVTEDPELMRIREAVRRHLRSTHSANAGAAGRT